MRYDDDRLRQYLLGELSEEDQALLEARLLEEDDLFERVEAVEADLLEEHAHGGLSAAQHAHIRRRLASSPAARSRLSVIRALGKVAREEKPARPVLIGPWGKAESIPHLRALAAAVLAIAVLAGWMDYRSSRLQKEIEVMASQSMQRPPRPIVPPPPSPVIPYDDEKIAQTKPTPRPVEPPVPPPVVSQLFELALTAFRGPEAVEVLRVEPGTERVDIQLSLLSGDETYPAYEVVIRDSATGEELIRREGLHPEKAAEKMALLLSIEADKLRPGLYEAAVKGLPAKGEPQEISRPQFEVAEPEMNPPG